MSDSPSRFEIDFIGHARDVDDVVLGGPSLMNLLVRASGARGYLPFDASLDEAVAHFGMPPNAALDLWMVCGPFDRMMRRWTGKGLEWPGQAAPVPAVSPVSSDEPVGPDEAVGKPPNGAHDNGQQRLTGA